MVDPPARTYDIGDTVRLKGTFTDPDSGAPVSPVSVTSRVLQPDGVLATVTMTETALNSGAYVGYFNPTQAGEHWYEIVGAGTYNARSERRFTVRPRRVT